MGLKTGVIRYNIKERGRKYIGKDRNFNVPRIVDLINGPMVQELVASGDLVGYLGHGIRQNYGFNPDEVVQNTKDLVSIDPAIRTKSIKAYDDGTIEHEEEFLDTALGKKAQSWYESKIGGFSSIFTPTEASPTQFWGFDYVRAPNFATNRGYVMDGIDREYFYNKLQQKEKLEYVSALQDEQQAVFDAVLSSVGDIKKLNNVLVNSNTELAYVLDNLGAEKDELESLLVEANQRLSSYSEPERVLSLNRNNPIAHSMSVMDSIQEQVFILDDPQIKEPLPMKKLIAKYR